MDVTSQNTLTSTQPETTEPGIIPSLPVFEDIPSDAILWVDSTASAHRAFELITASGAVGITLRSKRSASAAVTPTPHVLAFGMDAGAVVVPCESEDGCVLVRRVLANDAVIKAGFQLDGTRRRSWVYRFGTKVTATVDLTPALALLSPRETLGLQSATALLLGQRLLTSNSIRQSDWTTRPLSIRQLTAAVNDACATRRIFDVLRSKHPDWTRVHRPSRRNDEGGRRRP